MTSISAHGRCLRIAILGCAVVLAVALAGESAEIRPKRVPNVPEPVISEFARADKVAIVVGIGSYSNVSGFSRLKYAKLDGLAVAAELRQHGYRVTELYDEQAVAGAVLQAIERAKGAINAASATLVFFFSGHGYELTEGNYLVGFDAIAERLQQTGLQLSEVERSLKATGAKRVLMWIDACRNAPTTDTKGSAGRSFGAFAAAQGVHALFSSGHGSVSYESDDLRHGVFTSYLVQALRGDAAGNDGWITSADVSSFVIAGVRQWGFENHRTQVPFEAGERSGEFLIASRESAAGTAAERPGRDAEAERHFEAGAELYRDMRFEDAAVEFDRAFQRDPLRLDYMFNLGRTLVLAGRCDKAIGYLQMFVDSAPASSYPKQVSTARDLASSCAARAGQHNLEQTQSPGAGVEKLVQGNLTKAFPLSPNTTGAEAEYKKRAERIFEGLVHLDTPNYGEFKKDPGLHTHCVGTLYLLPEAIVYVSSENMYEVVRFEGSETERSNTLSHVDTIPYDRLNWVTADEKGLVITLESDDGRKLSLYPMSRSRDAKETLEPRRARDILEGIRALRSRR